MFWLCDIPLAFTVMVSVQAFWIYRVCILRQVDMDPGEINDSGYDTEYSYIKRFICIKIYIAKRRALLFHQGLGLSVPIYVIPILINLTSYPPLFLTLRRTMSALEPTGASQPTLDDVYTAPGNPAESSPAEQAAKSKNANSNSGQAVDQRIPTTQSTYVPPIVFPSPPIAPSSFPHPHPDLPYLFIPTSPPPPN